MSAQFGAKEMLHFDEEEIFNHIAAGYHSILEEPGNTLELP